ncbi:MAG TPA: hypothetical protein VFI72_08745, partial [Candidatus Angelobacter sp.]|nr:hypothetical protein [Candidatus Angelobacter sp.]
ALLMTHAAALQLEPKAVPPQSAASDPQAVPPEQQPAQPEPEMPNHAERLRAGKARIPANTALKFALVEPLSSATAKAGDQVQLRLMRPLVAGDDLILPEGTLVRGRVKKVRHAESACHNAELEWVVDRIAFSDASQARTQITMVKSDPKAVVPYQMPVSGLSWGQRVFIGVVVIPLAGPVVAVAGVLIGPYEVARHLDGREERAEECKQPGKEIEFPANSVVAVTLTKAHTVTY